MQYPWGRAGRESGIAVKLLGGHVAVHPFHLGILAVACVGIDLPHANLEAGRHDVVELPLVECAVRLAGVAGQLIHESALGVANVPDSNGSIFAAGDHRFAIWRKDREPHLAFVPLQCRGLRNLGAGHVP